MPILKQAIKKLRHDHKRTSQNKLAKNKLSRTIKKMRTIPESKTLSQVFSLLDKAVKNHLIHRNTASRLKSRLSLRLTK